MLDTKAQSLFADATAAMMRACALATARAADRSMREGMSFWSRLMRAPAAEGGQSSLPIESVMPQPDARPQNSGDAPDAAFSSYRSSGGHAAAQVIVSDTPV